MIKIGDFSKLSRISIRMLRHYDEMDLLKPQSIDQMTNYRYYSAEQLTMASRITALKDMGFSLSAISEILKRYDDSKALSEFLEIKKNELEVEAEVLGQRLLRLETTIARLRKDEKSMKYNVILKKMPQRTVASVRRKVPSYSHEFMLWNTLLSETSEMGLKEACIGSGLAIFHDEGYKESDVDVEIQLPLKTHFKDTENVVFKTVEEIEYASATYKGSYDQITEVNHSVAQWVTDNGYEFDGSMFCIYHVSPAQTQNMDELVTEVCFPVKSK